MNKNRSVVIVTYRDREAHLNEFINTGWDNIRKYVPNCTLLIIEQEEDDKLFNKGRLYNIGVHNVPDSTTYIFTHDVDIIPTEKSTKNIYTICNYDVLRIYCAGKTLGGICKFTKQCLLDVNGLPNYLWGWGIEDRVLLYRCRYMKKNISRMYGGRYKSDFNFLPHPKNSRWPYSGELKDISDKEDRIANRGTQEEQHNHMMSSGLNNIKYETIDKSTIGEDIELLKVRI